MGLPILEVPTFDVIIPSTNKKVKCRPYLVKEEKILLMALGSDNESQILNAVKQILNNCIVDKQNHDIESLAVFDLEYILIKIRARSRGEAINLKFSGIEGSECEECQKPKFATINLNAVEIKRTPNHTNKIQLTENVGVVMSYPKLKSADLTTKIQDDMLIAIDLIKECVESIYDKDSVFNRNDISDSELTEFIENLQKEQFEKLYDFLITMPKIQCELDLSCKKCGRKDIQIISGLQNFFL